MELKINGVARDGAGVARAEDGQVIFVEGALPDETVTVELTKVKKRWARARVLEVLNPSPLRIPVTCTTQQAGCGGCDLLHLSPDSQLAMKANIVLDQLDRAQVAAPSPVLWPLVNDQGRTTVRSIVKDGQAGYRMRGSHEVILPTKCEALDPMVEEILLDGRFGEASQVTIRVGSRTDDRLVLVEGDPEEVSVPSDVLVVSAKELSEGRRAWIHEEAADRKWRISARSFFQNRPAGVDALVSVVSGMVDALGTDGPMVDAYAGIGVFAGTVGHGRSVVAIERNSHSIADARVNLDAESVKIIKASVESWNASPAALVIADPAREGVGKAAMATLLAAEPSLFVLVSCEPGAFAADAALLAAGGMRLEQLTVVDMFPGTTHGETVGAFIAS